MSCASGVPMAWQAADAITARLTGAKTPPTSRSATSNSASPSAARKA